MGVKHSTKEVAPAAKTLTATDLSRGEKLYLFRKRIGYNQLQMSVDLGVCLGEYRAMEVDDMSTKAPFKSLGKLHPHEVFVIRRKRKGWSGPELAKRVGVSSFWIREMEKGAATLERLEEFWSTQP